MNALLFTFLLLQTGPQNAGAVGGVVRGANGAPAAGVRVYAVAVRDTADATSPAPLESLTETDTSGRYRLEVAPGRYYIASGSVGSPTYFPGTTNVAAARVVTVTAGALADGIDFSSFVPASRTPTGVSFQVQLPPGSTGVLSGVIRTPTGTPASGIPVIAFPVSRIGATSTAPQTVTIQTGAVPLNVQTLPLLGANVLYLLRSPPVRTDANGRYRIESLPPDTYYLAAGYAESPSLYPGTSDITAAQTFTTTPTTNLDTLDFTVPLPTQTTVSGRVTAFDSAAPGATVQLRSASPAASIGLQLGLPTLRFSIPDQARTDGTFEFTGVSPGTYTVEASYAGTRSTSRTIVVADQPVTDVDFTIRVSVLSGRILLEDGSPVPDAKAFGEAIVTTIRNPNLIASTLFQISVTGTFSRIIEADEYRFYLRTLPNEYTIKSITSGTADLLKESLKVADAERIDIDVRVAKRTAPADSPYVSVSGTVLDALSGLPAQAERMTLCCLASEPSERLSTPLRADGSFDFASVPPGRYTLGLQAGPGQAQLYTVNSNVSVASQPVSGLTFASTPRLGQLMAKVVFEDGRPLAEDSPASVVFTGSGERVRVVAERGPDGVRIASLPVGDRYTVSVVNLPEGFIVKSISGSTEVQAPNYPATGAPPPGSPSVVITLGAQR